MNFVTNIFKKYIHKDEAKAQNKPKNNNGDSISEEVENSALENFSEPRHSSLLSDEEDYFQDAVPNIATTSSAITITRKPQSNPLNSHSSNIAKNEEYLPESPNINETDIFDNNMTDNLNLLETVEELVDSIEISQQDDNFQKNVQKRELEVISQQEALEIEENVKIVSLNDIFSNSARNDLQKNKENSDKSKGALELLIENVNENFVYDKKEINNEENCKMVESTTEQVSLDKENFKKFEEVETLKRKCEDVLEAVKKLKTETLVLELKQDYCSKEEANEVENIADDKIVKETFRIKDADVDNNNEISNSLMLKENYNDNIENKKNEELESEGTQKFPEKINTKLESFEINNEDRSVIEKKSIEINIILKNEDDRQKDVKRTLNEKENRENLKIASSDLNISSIENEKNEERTNEIIKQETDTDFNMSHKNEGDSIVKADLNFEAQEVNKEVKISKYSEKLNVNLESKKNEERIKEPIEQDADFKILNKNEGDSQNDSKMALLNYHHLVVREGNKEEGKNANPQIHCTELKKFVESAENNFIENGETNQEKINQKILNVDENLVVLEDKKIENPEVHSSLNTETVNNKNDQIKKKLKNSTENNRDKYLVDKIDTEMREQNNKHSLEETNEESDDKVIEMLKIETFEQHPKKDEQINNEITTYDRQDTKEFEQLECEYEANFINHERQDTDNILEELVTKSKTDIKDDQCEVGSNNSINEKSFFRQDTLEFEKLEKQCNEVTCLDVLDELVAQNTKETVNAERKEFNESGFEESIEKKVQNKLQIQIRSVNRNKPLVEAEKQEARTVDEELKRKVDNLQQELDNLRKMNRRKEKSVKASKVEMEENMDVVSKFKNVIHEYEKHIVQQNNDLEKLKIENERNMRHFSNTEMAFSDVFEKYEKAKYVIAAYSKNEDILLENLQNAEEQLTKIETKCVAMKEQSFEQIKRAKEQVEQEKRKYNQELGKLQAQVKRLEIKASSLETALKQKTDECEALASLCDDITGRNE